MGKYYIRIDGKTFGPYTAKVMMELGLTPDIMVTEGSKDAWQPGSNFDFGQLAKQEILEKLNSTPANVAPDKAPTIEVNRCRVKGMTQEQCADAVKWFQSKK